MSMADVFEIDLCGSCKEKSTKKCSHCQLTSYCSTYCQKQDRKSHVKLMQCSSENSTIMKDQNKILFGDFANAQALLSFAFLGEGLEFGQNDEIIRNHLEEQTELMFAESAVIRLSMVLPELLDVKLFKSYKGDVYFHSNCFEIGEGILDWRRSHLPKQNLILVSSDDQTSSLTPRVLLTAISNGVVISSESEAEQYMHSNSRPMLICGKHRQLSEIELHQIKDGILIAAHFK